MVRTSGTKYVTLEYLTEIGWLTIFWGNKLPGNNNGDGEIEAEAWSP